MLELNHIHNHQMKKLVLLLFIIGISFSCAREKIDFDNLDDLRFGVGIQTPLVNATLTLSDLLLEDTVLTEDPDGGLRIIFNQDSIFSLSVIDFVSIPEQTPTSIPVIYDTSSSAVPLDIDLALGTLAGAELAIATFDSGFLKYEITSGVAVNSDVDIRLVLKNATLNGSVFDNVFTLPQGTTSYVDSIDISGLVFDLSNGGTAVNFIGLKLNVESADSASNLQLFNLSINFVNLGIANATGFFGYRVVNLPNGQFDFDVQAFENFANGFFLTNPLITLNVENGLGIELDLDLDLFGVNGVGTVTDLGLQKQSIVSPTTAGAVANSAIAINKTNSEIVDFLAALPNQITYGGSATLNPSAENGGSVANFIDKSSTINANLIIDLPLEFRAQNMFLEENLDFTLFDDTTQTDQVQKLVLFFKVENGFPFDVNLDIAFLDSVSGDSLDGINLQLLTAAPVDGNGRVTQKITSNESISLDNAQLAGLVKANRMRIRATLNTTNGGLDPVKLFTDYDLGVKIAAETELKVAL